ncbi:MAG: glutathione S-transferase family protein [Alphaproteobacteria bacterium]
MMKLLNSKNSPYGRKTMIVAHALGLAEHISVVPTDTRADEKMLRSHNPLGKIPTLITDDGVAIADSFAIILYLQKLAGSDKFFPCDIKLQYQVMRYHAIADGICNAVVLMVQNKMRKEETAGIPLDDKWIKRQIAAVNSGIDFMAKHFNNMAPQDAEELNIVAIALLTGLDYLDFRFPDWGWQSKYQDLSQWRNKMHQNPFIAKTTKPF